MRRPFRRSLPLLLALCWPGIAPGGEEPPCESGEPLLRGLPRSEYQARRRELMTRILKAESEPGPGWGRAREPVVVLRGAPDPDIEGKFRQTSNFTYLTGVSTPDAYLILLPTQDHAMLYLPPPPPGAGAFIAARPVPGPETAEALGFERVESTDRLLSDLFGAIGDPLVWTHRPRSTVVYLESPDPGPSDAGPAANLTRLLKQGAPTTRLKDLDPPLASLRKSKSPAELHLILRAVAITGAAHEAVARTLRPGLAEYALEGEIMGAFLRGGAARAAFPSIVGSGPNATIPHYFDNRRTIESGDLVVVDIGAEYLAYAADITRTYPADGRFTPRQREIYQLVLDAQKAVEAEMTPGETLLADMTEFVREFFRASPLRARDGEGREQTMDHFFNHGLGHYLGLDVHDVGSYAEPVQVGDVFTIEPGLYIPDERIGVRIEDDYIMTEYGPKKLSGDIPSEPGEIEQWISAGVED